MYLQLHTITGGHSSICNLRLPHAMVTRTHLTQFRRITGIKYKRNQEHKHRGGKKGKTKEKGKELGETIETSRSFDERWRWGEGNVEGWPGPYEDPWLITICGGHLLSLRRQNRGFPDLLKVRPSSLLIWLEWSSNSSSPCPHFLYIMCSPAGFLVFLDFLTLEYGTDTLSRNVGKRLTFCAS
jgi:hypothetical protein